MQCYRSYHTVGWLVVIDYVAADGSFPAIQKAVTLESLESLTENQRTDDVTLSSCL